MIPATTELVTSGNAIPHSWRFTPDWIESDNDLYPGKLTRHCHYLALALAREFVSTIQNANIYSRIYGRQLQTVFVLAHSEAVERKQYAKAKRGRKSTAYYHQGTGSILRQYGCKLGRFVFGKQLPDGSIIVGYVLASVNASQQWSERPVHVWRIASNGDILKSARAK